MYRLNNNMTPGTTVITCEWDHITTITDILEVFDVDQDVVVMSYNIKKSKIEQGNVTTTRSSSGKDFISIETENPAVSVTLTPEHRVYDCTKQKYVRCGDMTKKSKVLHDTGEELDVVRVDQIKNNNIETVYSINVTDNYNYFANGVLVSC